MDKLEELLSLLQTYGVTSYSDKEISLTLVHIPEHSEEVTDGPFEISYENIQVFGEEDPEPN